MGAAAEAIFLRTRGALLSRIRSHAAIELQIGLCLSNMSFAFKLRSDLCILRSVIVALAKTGNAKIGKRPKQQKRDEALLPDRSVE